jgi:hypothetical protein
LIPIIYVTYIVIEHSESKLWHAVFKNDYSELLVLDHKKNRLAGPTVLVNELVSCRSFAEFGEGIMNGGEERATPGN